MCTEFLPHTRVHLIPARILQTALDLVMMMMMMMMMTMMTIATMTVRMLMIMLLMMMMMRHANFHGRRIFRHTNEEVEVANHHHHDIIMTSS